MTEKLVKEGVKLAEEQLRDKQIQEVKKIVLKTLEKIDVIDKEIIEAKEEVKKLEEEKKILKLDIDDLKEGRIDRIAERQEKNEKAKEISVVVIIKEKEVHHHYDHWHYPYQVFWKQVDYIRPTITVQTPNIYCGGTTISTGWAFGASNSTIDCSTAKFATLGTYTVNGTAVNLR